MTCPCMSVMLTSVLLKVARMLATPLTMFLAPLALMIFLPAISSASNSAAVGAAGAAAGTPASAGLAGASAVGGAPSGAGGTPFRDALAGCASPAGVAAAFSAATSGFASFLGFFLGSSAIGTVVNFYL